jgi:hypothetical protein
VRGVAFVVAVGSIAGLALFAGPGRASLYSPDEPFALEVDEGKPDPLPFTEFKRQLTVLTNAVNDTKVDGKYNSDRQKFLDRIAKMEPKAKEGGKPLTEAEREKAFRKMPETQAVSLATDLLRTAQIDKALNLMGQRAQRGGYFVISTLAHVHAARGEWADAIRYIKDGQLDLKMPAEVKGLTKGQRNWWEKLDTDYVPRFYEIRKQQMDARKGLTPAELDKSNETEDVLPLFPLPGEDGKPRPPVRFVNDAGIYEPGKLAAAEQAKLPPDAIAIVQQLLLWFPSEVRLYWLLGELYAANDDLESAEIIFGECVGSRAHGNLKVLMEHRQAVRSAIEARRPPPPEQPAISMKTVFIYFGAVGLVALIAVARALMKRGRAAPGQSLSAGAD